MGLHGERSSNVGPFEGQLAPRRCWPNDINGLTREFGGSLRHTSMPNAMDCAPSRSRAIYMAMTRRQWSEGQVRACVITVFAILWSADITANDYNGLASLSWHGWRVGLQWGFTASAAAMWDHLRDSLHRVDAGPTISMA